MKVVSLLLADKVTVDEKTKKVNIEGIFNLINAPGLPAKHGEFFVFIAAEGQAGKHTFSIEIKKGSNIIASTRQEFETGSKHYFISTFKDLVFNEDGAYEVIAGVDNNYLSSLLEIKISNKSLN